MQRYHSTATADGVFGALVELISDTPSLKLRLVFLAFLLFGVPTSIAINFGVPEMVALSTMLGVLPLAVWGARMISTQSVTSLKIRTGDKPESMADRMLPHLQSVEDQIESLYEEIIALAHEEPAEAPTIERAYAQLRELQMAEARQYREWFEASLKMPIDAGDRILARARALREELEDTASSDPAVQDADKP